jgi:hypothetical protein
MKKGSDSQRTQLLLLMGRLLAIVHEAEPLPEMAWGNWFAERMALPHQKTAHQTREIAALVQHALRSSSYQKIDEMLWKAIHGIQLLVGESEMGIRIDDPYWVGKQVVSRIQEGETITYGRIESSLVFLDSTTPYDSWVVKVRPGYRINAESNAFVRYNGPLYQPGEQVFYLNNGHALAATILGPGFAMRGCFGFNISFHERGKQEYRYAVPSQDLSSHA